MIEFHYLIYILFLTATSSKQISVGVILPFYDGLWGYYGDQFLRKGILILEGPNTDKNSDAFSILLFEELNKFNLCTDEYCMLIKVDNWDASNVKKIINDLSEEFKQHLGFVAAANDDIGLEFYKQFTTHHDNVKEKVDELCKGMKEKFVTVDMGRLSQCIKR